VEPLAFLARQLLIRCNSMQIVKKDKAELVPRTEEKRQ